MTNNWFNPEELRQMSLPTMDKVVELIEAKDYMQALSLSRDVKKEWSFLHRLMAESFVALIDLVDKEFEDISPKILVYVYERVWKHAFKEINDDDRKEAAKVIVKSWLELNVHPSNLLHHDTFTLELVKELTKPKLDRVVLDSITIKADEEVIKECIKSKHEWGLLHDLLVESIAACLTFIGDSVGEENVGFALKKMTEKVWKVPMQKMESMDRKQIATALAATWRAHSTGGVGNEHGKFTIIEDDEKITYELEPCGSGQRLWRQGIENPDKKYGFTEKKHFWSFNRSDFPYYCSHCTYMNEIMPIEWTGAPIYPLDPPKSPDHPCKWYFYKDKNDVPERFYERYGYQKGRVEIPNSQESKQ